MTRVAVLGSGGLLAGELVPHLISLGHEVVRDRPTANANARLDLTNETSLREFLDGAEPAVILNLAALTDVDRCEIEPNAAYQSNVLIVELIVNWVQARAPTCRIVQLSTDQVYDGTGPHRENATFVCNTYALSKRAGELVALSVGATVLRTNFFGRSRSASRRSFSDWIVDNLRNGRPLRVFDDVIFSPLSTRTLSEEIARAVDRPLSGVYNVGSHEGMSKANFAFELAERLGLPERLLTRVSIREQSLHARRPTDMTLDCAKYEAAVGVQLPTLFDELTLVERAYRSEL